MIFHVLNRGVGRQEIFAKSEDYAGFERVLAHALEAVPVSLLAYCLMPNHWHLLLRPQADGDESSQALAQAGRRCRWRLGR
ncbi:MAG TPA: transposase [Tepidisphaeraceae bacterium]|nr:transposase [Tepidisphaeraceae bacterium]